MAGDELGREIDLVEPETVIGRGDDVQLRVFSRSVSRRHARILRLRDEEEERFRLDDLGSTNGTLVNNIEVETVNLHNGDKIQVGEVIFKFVVQDAMDAKFHKDIHRLIHFDQLTGLMTMESFRRMLEDAIRFAPAGSVFCLSMTDLDGLKRVNDTYGHLAGRKTVETMGHMMRETLRPADRAGLYGGDEAIVFYPNSTLDEAKSVAEKLRQVVESRVIEHEGRQFQVTISQGLAEWPAHGKSAEALIAAADRALYEAKAAGRNRVFASE
jgi:diguanylate cyclase (GGDEF)-like protein